MKIFYIPITNKESIRNYENTVKKRINFKKENILEVTDNCGVWGFKNGESNERNYDLISKDDIVFFRINDNEKYQCFDGFGRVLKKEKNSELANFFWNDLSYENLIYIDKVVIFEKPFRLAKNNKKIEGLKYKNIWHDGYNMFREWKLKEDDLIKKPEDLIEYFFSLNNTVIYDIRNKENNLYEINEDVDLSLFNTNTKETEIEVLTKARRGQAVLKEKLYKIKKKCELCGISKKELLIASHIKPWSESTDKEKLDLNNVFLFCPNHDQLFDKGFISFNDDGKILISKEIDEQNKIFSNINFKMKIKINDEQKKYLEYHRKEIFKK